MDNKTKAEHHRRIAEELEALAEDDDVYIGTAAGHRTVAAKLDPPSPKYAPGTIAWCTYHGATFLRVKQENGFWADRQGDSISGFRDEDWHDIEVIPIVPPGHIVIPVQDGYSELYYRAAQRNFNDKNEYAGEALMDVYRAMEKYRGDNDYD